VPKTVLLSDNSSTIQRVVSLTFGGDDVTVVSVDDGTQAIASIERSRPDLVLADIATPGLTGYEVAEFVRSRPQLASIPVLLLAGAFDRIDEDRARAVGADGVFTKPFDPLVLLARARELLVGGRGATPSAFAQAPAAPVPAFLPPQPEAVTAAGIESRPDAGIDAPQPGAAAPTAPPPSSTEAYFAEVDRALTAMASAPRSIAPPPAGADALTEPADAAIPSPDDDVMPSPDDAARPFAGEAARPSTDIGAPAPGVQAPDRRAGAASPSIALTDAFAALLDAEQSGDAGAAGRQVAALVPPPVVEIDMDALVDQVVRRVLAQMTDRVVRETVAGIVTDSAERLVREEIDRIKRNIK
jgi:CheY-like chemotaxis protein